MTKLFSIVGAAAGCLALAALAGCSADEDDDFDEREGPAVEEDGLQTRAKITNNGWVADARTPTTWIQTPIPGLTYWDMQGKAVFTRTSGPTTRAAGMCLLKRAGTQTCTTDATCPDPFGNGGKYCAPINGAGTKYCWYRGANTSWCAGSPALPWKNTSGQTCTPGTANCYPQKVAPGTYVNPWVSEFTGGNVFISYACFEGCSASDPSISSSAMPI